MINEIIKRNGVTYGIIIGLISSLTTASIYAININLFTSWWLGILSVLFYIVFSIILLSKTKKALNGVFTFKEYARELTQQLQKHFDNFGRFAYSVADSSFDTWLDGYTPGAPGRKVSIYTEGCLLAFVTDIQIRLKTGNKLGLDEVMKRLYFNFTLQNKGVSEADYISVVKSLAGEDFQSVFDDYFYLSKFRFIAAASF